MFRRVLIKLKKENHFWDVKQSTPLILVSSVIWVVIGFLSSNSTATQSKRVLLYGLLKYSLSITAPLHSGVLPVGEWNSCTKNYEIVYNIVIADGIVYNIVVAKVTTTKILTQAQQRSPHQS